MAKKIVNVVYKVDDSELTKAKVSIQQVAAETKKSEKAMTDLSGQAKKTGNDFSNTIAGVTLQMQRLKAQIDLTNQADTARLTKLKADYDQAKAKLDQYNKSLNDTKTTGQSVLGVFQNLQTTVATVFSALAIKQVISMGLEMNKLAGQVEGVRIGFNRAFGNAPLILDQLRKATHNTVSDFDLMKRTLQATNLGVSVEHLGVLFEFAAARAQQTGESVDYLVDSIVRGVGRKSILVLDNLGLSATRLKEQFGGASLASQSVADVTKGVAAIAKVELEKMGGYVETSATKVDQLGASWEKLKQTVAKKTETSGLIGFWNDVLDKIDKSLKSTSELSDEIATNTATNSVNKFLQSGEQTQSSIEKEINLRSQNVMAMKAEREALRTSNNANSNNKSQFLRIDIEAQQKSIQLLEKYGAELAKVKVPEKEQVGLIEAIEMQIDALNEQIKKAASPQAIGALNDQLKDLNLQLNTLKNATAKPDNFKFSSLGFNPEEEKKKGDILIDLKKRIQAEILADDIVLREQSKAKQKEWDKADLDELKAQEDRKKALRQATENFALGAAQETLYALFINRQTDTSDVEANYQKQLDAAGNNENAKKQIQAKIDKDRAVQRQRQLEADRNDAITKIEIDTAINVIRSIANNGGIPYGLPFGALALAAGIAEVATVKSVKSNSLQARAFAEGEVGIKGPGSATSDSIPAWLSNGESIITAGATNASRNLLEAINERKIDDSILYRLAGDGGKKAERFDDRGIIEAIKNNKVDYINQGYSLMKAEKTGSNFKRIIRSKVQGY